MEAASLEHGTDLRERIRDHLRAFQRVALDLEGRRHAAVALALVADADDRPCFVLTRRASRLRRHAGQWALPATYMPRGTYSPGLSFGSGSIMNPYSSVGSLRIRARFRVESDGTTGTASTTRSAGMLTSLSEISS